MIARAIGGIAMETPEAVAVSCGGRTLTYAELHVDAMRLAKGLRGLAGQRVAVVVADFIDQLLCLLALDRIGATAILYLASGTAAAENAAVSNLEPAGMLSDLPGWDALLKEAREGAAGMSIPADEESRVILFTSGTSGTPKPVVHTWESLGGAVKDDGRYRGRRWLLTYNQAGFAALQVVLQCLLTGGRLSVPASREPEVVSQVLVDDQVAYATGTPTFWRMLLHGSSPERLSAASLQQISLGGEVVSQGVLDLLRATFPGARLTHIYASTEMGTCFAVTDGREGFPASYLSDPFLPCQLRIGDGGELMIRSRRAMVARFGEEWDPEAWFGTGDLVEVSGDRCVFVGRRSDCINVGGAKVYPLEVETVIRAVPGVREVLVKGRRNAIVGELVTADVVLEEGFDPAVAKKSIAAECRLRLAHYKAPAIVEFKQRLGLTDSYKLSRRAE